jgi:adenosylhomocysteinase
VEYLVKQVGKLEKTVYRVPRQIDREIARLKLASMDIQVDELTPDQEAYLSSWTQGT